MLKWMKNSRLETTKNVERASILYNIPQSAIMRKNKGFKETKETIKEGSSSLVKKLEMITDDFGNSLKGESGNQVKEILKNQMIKLNQMND